MDGPLEAASVRLRIRAERCRISACKSPHASLHHLRVRRGTSAKGRALHQHSPKLAVLAAGWPGSAEASALWLTDVTSCCSADAVAPVPGACTQHTRGHCQGSTLVMSKASHRACSSG